MADYTTSTQHLYWEGRCDPVAIESRDERLREEFPLPEPRLLVNHFLSQQISKLGRRMQTRQIVLATAQVFAFRFFSRVDIRKTNPYLVLVTAFYMACKIEECHKYIRVIATEARNLWPDCIQADMAKIGECEFWVISELNAQLIVHHPYTDLSELQKTLSLSSEEMAAVWSVINDHYVTALPLQRPPKVIAIAAIVLVLVVRTSQGSGSGARPGGAQANRAEQIMRWLGKSEMDIAAVAESVQELVSMYAALERYNEKTCKEQLGKLARARGLN